MNVQKMMVIGLISVLNIAACTRADTSAHDSKPTDSIPSLQVKDMKSYVSIFEIPAKDISRAIRFYEDVLGIKIEQMEVEGMQMGIFPYQDQLVTGLIIQAEGYTPSPDGVTVYLQAGENLEAMLDRVKANGGNIKVPKTAHADGNGFFAIFIDSEGNKLGLSSNQ